MAGRTYLYAISLGAHALLGAALFAVPAELRHEIIAISMSETSKPKPPPPPDPPPPLPDPPKAAAQPLRAKAAPAPKAAEVAPVNPGASTEAIPDFGLSLSNGDGIGGLAIPAARAAAPPPVVTTTKTLSRAARAPVDDCADPPAKPKLLSGRPPDPEYNAQARAAEISGKLRVEITVDERGNITQVRVLQGLGYGLDEAAVAAARTMRFEPAVRCGKPVSATFKVGFTISPGTP